MLSEAGIAALVAAVTGGSLWISHKIRERKIAETRPRVAACADGALEISLKDGGDKPVAGLLAEKDAGVSRWNCSSTMDCWGCS